MSFRSGESPMEFSWDNGSGPVDECSPWMAAINKNKSSLQSLHNHPKRSRSEFEFAPKSLTTVSNFPASRLVNGSKVLLPHLPRELETSLPKPPSKEIDINSFRASDKQSYDFISGDDTPERSRAGTGAADSLASDRPDADSKTTDEQSQLQPRSRDMGNSPSRPRSLEKRDGRASPRKRQSFLDKTLQTLTKKKEYTYSHKAEARVAKKRRHVRVPTRARSHKSSTHETDTEPDTNDEPHTFAAPRTGLIASFLGVVESHPNAPRILINYLQLFFNILFVLFLVFVVYSFWTGVVADVDHGVNEKAAEAILRHKDCHSDWLAFRCAERPERTRQTCEEIAACLANNPDKIARAQVSANTFGKILNDFAEPISFKAMFFYFTTIATVWMASNLTWNSLRTRFSPENTMQPQQQFPFNHHHSFPPLPATPSRHADANDSLLYNLPYQQQQLGYYAPNPSNFISHTPGRATTDKRALGFT